MCLAFDRSFYRIHLFVSTRLRKKPKECEVVVNGPEKEPEPFPADWYEGYYQSEPEYELEMCNGNAESDGKDFRYMSAVFQYPAGNHTPGAAIEGQYTYPMRQDVAESLKQQAPFDHKMCG